MDFSQIRPADVRAGRTFMTLNTGRHVSVRFSHNYEPRDVAGGRLFSAHVPEARIVYQRDLRTLVRLILQYSNVTRNPALYLTRVAGESRDVFAQLLFSYKVNAQTALLRLRQRRQCNRSIATHADEPDRLRQVQLRVAEIGRLWNLEWRRPV